MMASDDVPPPEGVAHTVAAHTSRIAKVRRTRISHLSLNLPRSDLPCVCVIEIPSHAGSSNTIYCISMGRHNYLINRIYVADSPSTRVVHW